MKQDEPETVGRSCSSVSLSSDFTSREKVRLGTLHMSESKEVVMETGEKRQFTPEEWMSLTNYFVGNDSRFRENVIVPKILSPVRLKTNEEKMVEGVMESCAFKSVMSCVMGKWIMDKYTLYNVNRHIILNLNRFGQVVRGVRSTTVHNRGLWFCKFTPSNFDKTFVSTIIVKSLY